ncbi:hypothetical protein [Bradyrhizobium icense]|uniref:Uncharacterized protein n=1 Tax=Bradyrhizobium icense TaxID=1274631 RepID=A0A1B1UG31_9BRAD|nr:hypothetical protein [Bradyrhizobium icense]ANW01705.1 hypothetical protein LMTR13_17560 [Bradyrhizobium icense]
MATVWDGQKDGEEPVAAATLASQILEHADRDVTFVVHLVGESQNLLVRHFVVFIEIELAKRDIGYDAHPFLRPFIETHARELTDFVLQGVGLRHQFGLQALETMAGDPARLLRVDLWDSLRSHINDAQLRFASGVGGLQRLLIQIRADA